MAQIGVNPDVLTWARQERGLDEGEAAQRTGLSVEDLVELEAGVRQPSIGELRAIAKGYQIAFASLLMPEPLPIETRPQIEDFRAGIEHSEPGERPFELNLAIENVFVQIDTLGDLKRTAPELFIEFNVPRIQLGDNVEEVAAEERRRVGFTLEEQLQWERPKQSFETLRLIIESQGAFVSQSNLGPIDIVRGFSHFDQRQIPVAVVNQEERDYGPRNFTLLHEYAHLMLRRTGISDENRDSAVERFCNQFAAYFLMPREDFTRTAHRENVTGAWTDRELGSIADAFKVSLSAVAIHLETIGLAAAGLYEQKLAAWRQRNVPRRTGGRATWPERWMNQLGIRTTQVVLNALGRQAISLNEAYEILDVRPRFFDQLRAEMNQRIADYGGDGGRG